MTKIETKEKWLEWAIKLQGLAQAGLYYTNNEFERERYREIQDIACQILSEHSTVEIDQINQYFTCYKGYKTPKLDSRAVCIKDNQILLAQESNGLWSVPGGWMDVDQTLSNNCKKEALEEAGAVVEPLFVIAIHDWRTHVDIKYKHIPFEVVKILVMCDFKDMEFKPNSETLQAKFFDRDNLPVLALSKNNYKQIELCFQAYDCMINGDNWQTQFD